MKRTSFTLFSICFLGLSTAFSQSVDEVPIKELDVEYIQIMGDPRFLSNKLTIEVDFGQRNSFWSAKDTKVTDENGNPMVFNSMAEALNLFIENGYEYVDALLVSGQQVNQYVLKKKREK